MMLANKKDETQSHGICEGSTENNLKRQLILTQILNRIINF